MPVATINTEETQRFDLKSLPDAYVVLKRLSYGEWLTRQEMAVQIEIAGGGNGKDATGSLAMANRKVTEWEFDKTIVDHNLTDEAENQLNFHTSGILGKLNPRVGMEIAQYISEMHDFEAVVPN